MAGAGDLDRRIRFERIKVARDDVGGVAADGWENLGTYWAKRTDMSDGERMAADERSAVRMTLFKVRSTEVTRGVTAKDRIWHDGAYYEISGIKETKEGRNNYIEVTAIVRNDETDNA